MNKKKQNFSFDELNQVLGKEATKDYVEVIKGDYGIAKFEEFKKRSDKIYIMVKNDYLIPYDLKPKYFSDQVNPIEKEIKEIEKEEQEETARKKAELEGYVEESINQANTLKPAELKKYREIKEQMEGVIQSELMMKDNPEQVEEFLNNLIYKSKNDSIKLRFLADNLYLFGNKIKELDGDIYRSRRLFDKVKDMAEPEKVKTLKKVKEELKRIYPGSRGSRLIKKYKEKQLRELEKLKNEYEQRKRQEEEARKRAENFTLPATASKYRI